MLPLIKFNRAPCHELDQVIPGATIVGYSRERTCNLQCRIGIPVRQAFNLNFSPKGRLHLQTSHHVRQPIVITETTLYSTGCLNPCSIPPTTLPSSFTIYYSSSFIIRGFPFYLYPLLLSPPHLPFTPLHLNPPIWDVFRRATVVQLYLHFGNFEFHFTTFSILQFSVSCQTFLGARLRCVIKPYSSYKMNEEFVLSLHLYRIWIWDFCCNPSPPPSHVFVASA